MKASRACCSFSPFFFPLWQVLIFPGVSIFIKSPYTHTFNIRLSIFIRKGIIRNPPPQYLHCLDTNPTSDYEIYSVSEAYYFLNLQCELNALGWDCVCNYYYASWLYLSSKTNDPYNKLSKSWTSLWQPVLNTSFVLFKLLLLMKAAFILFSCCSPMLPIKMKEQRSTHEINY